MQDELLDKLEKLNMLKKLGDLYYRGAKLSQNYNINSDINEMKREYDMQCEILRKKESEEFKKASSFATDFIKSIDEQYFDYENYVIDIEI